MKEIDELRVLLVGDEDALASLKIIDELLVAAEANAVRIESMQRILKLHMKQGRHCPFCNKGSEGHSSACYARKTTGFNMLEEHEATIRENDELRHALAPHLSEPAQEVLRSRPYRSLRDRLRHREATEVHRRDA